MKKINYFCDICGKDVTGHTIYTIYVEPRVVKHSELGYADKSPEFRDERLNEVCKDCIREIYNILKPRPTIK